MTTDPRPQAWQLNAFVDGELELAEQLEIEALMREDDGVRAQVESLRALRAAVRDEATYHRAPASLKARLGVAAPTEPAAEARARAFASRARTGLASWLAWRPLAGALASLAIAAVAIGLWLPGRGDADARLETDVIASHVRATLGDRLVDIPSSDHHTVKPWLSAKLDFSPPVPVLHLPATTFLGGRVDYLGGRPVAALVYRQGAHVVDSFVWPTSAGERPIEMDASRGFHLARWTRGGMQHWLVSDLNREELLGLAREIEAAESAR